VETISIQWKSYQVDSPEYNEAMDEALKTIQEERDKWDEGSIHPHVFDNVEGDLFGYMNKPIQCQTHGNWLNFFITLIRAQKNDTILGFQFSSPRRLFKAAQNNEQVGLWWEPEQKENRETVKANTSYKRGIITCIHEDKKIGNLTYKKINPHLSLYYEGDKAYGFQVDYDELTYILAYNQAKDEEFKREILVPLDLVEAQDKTVYYIMKKARFDIRSENEI
jgi:hypothetical protein